MAAPFTPFHANGSVNSAAVLPLAKLFKERLGITAVWVMGAPNPPQNLQEVLSAPFGTRMGSAKSFPFDN